jgi:hypothetical protein
MYSASKKYWVHCVYVVLILSTLAAYEPLRHNGFVKWDDGDYVTKNQHVTDGIKPESFLWAFTTSHAVNWHPLTWLSHMLDCELFGLNPFWHHLVNLLFHTANTLLLFWVLRRMTGAIWQSAFVAALFALHPLHVESVAWIAERKDVLSGFFWMLTMVAYVRYTEKPGITKYLLVVLFLGMGLMAKPMLVTLPFVLLLLDYWPLQRLGREYQNEKQAFTPAETTFIRAREFRVVRLIVEKAPLFVLVIFSSIATYAAQQKGIQNVPLDIRIGNAMVSYLGYLNKMIYPSGLAVFYPFGDLSYERVIIYFVHLSLISAAIIYLVRRGRRYLLVGWLWYLVTLVPVIGFVRVGGQAMADRYTYLPSIGIFIIVAWGAADFLAGRVYRIVPAIVAAAILLAMLLGTRAQVKYWRDSLTLWKRAIDVTSNNYIMQNNYGCALLEMGDTQEALKHFELSLQINPKFCDALSNKGSTLLALGRVDQAITQFTMLLQIEPNDAEVHAVLAKALVNKGENDEALEHLNTALKINPNLKEANELKEALTKKRKGQ